MEEGGIVEYVDGGGGGDNLTAYLKDDCGATAVFTFRLRIPGFISTFVLGRCLHNAELNLAHQYSLRKNETICKMVFTFQMINKAPRLARLMKKLHLQN